MNYQHPSTRDQYVRRSTRIAALALLACAIHSGATALAAEPSSRSIDGPTSPATPVESSAALGDDATLDDYIRIAALHDPELQAAYHMWQAERERAPQARALPDPRISYGYFIQSVETFTGPQENRLSASQQIPWPGKRRLAGEIASHEAEAARQRYEAQKLATVFGVVLAYAEYYHLGRAVEVTRENVELLTYWEALVRARYRVSDGSYPDIVNTQAELGKLDDRLRTLEDMRGPLGARLDELLNRDQQTLLPWPQTLPVTPVEARDEDLAAALETDNPQLGAATARMAAADRAIALAKTRYFPDVTVGIEWIETGDRAGQNLSNTGEDPVIATLSLNLPIWWHSYAAGVREAEARHAAARHARRHQALDLTTRVRRAHYELRDAARKIDLYGDVLIPKGREALDANFAAYESGRADLLDLLDAQRLLLEFRLSYERAVADHAVHRAELETLIGRSLPDSRSARRTGEEAS